MNVFSFYCQTLNAIQSNIPDKFIQDDNQTRGSYYADLKLATKEALVNTLMHAYYDSDTAIKAQDFDDSIEFFNPGNMRVTKEEFIHGAASRTRNAVIATLFRKVGIAEKSCFWRSPYL